MKLSEKIIITAGIIGFFGLIVAAILQQMGYRAYADVAGNTGLSLIVLTAASICIKVLINIWSKE